VLSEGMHIPEASGQKFQFDAVAHTGDTWAHIPGTWMVGQCEPPSRVPIDFPWVHQSSVSGLHGTEIDGDGPESVGIREASRATSARRM